MSIDKNFPKSFPKQHQDKQPGIEEQMNPLPIYDAPEYHNDGKRLKEKVAVITGGDSGIGRAVSLAFAREGAKVCIIYRDEHEDAKKTKELIDKEGGDCLLINGDVGCEDFCNNSIKKVIEKYEKIDILINNAAEQHPVNTLEELTKEQWERTFKTNLFGPFYLTKIALPHLKEGASIINTVSIVAYKGHEQLIDYATTKGGLVAFTRSLAKSLACKGIRVNGVAPGPIWTPLIPASFDEQKVSEFGSTNPMGRAGQPVELAEAYVFLASQGASYITGEVIHVNGGDMVET
ncbi:MAG: SDR family oxidoreductase [Clostridium perfringens]|nr:SDR family oxidoreductase [Clostridium perfringens]